MTDPVKPPSGPMLSAIDARQISRLSIGVAVVLIVLKAFALGASGSVSILASLVETALGLIALLSGLVAARWATDARYGNGKAQALAALVLAGLTFASATFIGWVALMRIFDPYPVVGGAWAVGVLVLSLALNAFLAWVQRRTQSPGPVDRGAALADLGAGLVVLIGVVSGAYLAAPGLDAAAGLVLAVWMFWGALGTLKPAADRLTTA